jgi:hypothetical protein
MLVVHFIYELYKIYTSINGYVRLISGGFAVTYRGPCKIYTHRI